MKQFTQEIEELKEEYYQNKFNTGLYAAAAIVMTIASIAVWIIGTFGDAFPMLIASFLMIMLTYKTWQCYTIIGYSIEILEMTDEIFDKSPLNIEDKDE